MVVIAGGFVEIESKVLKEQQSDKTLLPDQNLEQINTTQICNKDKEEDSDKVQPIEQQPQKITPEIRDFPRESADQEELDAIASINISAKPNDEYDKLSKNDFVFGEKKGNERKRKPSEDRSFGISTQKKFDKLGIQKTANENKEPQLKDPNKVCASDSKLDSFTPHGASGLIIENKEKVELNFNFFFDFSFLEE